MSIRAVLYARISGDENGEVSKLETQLADCRKFANEKGYTILREFQEDTYSSGADLDLPHLNEVLDLARGGAFEVLVCRELDRLARDLAKQLYIEDELKRSGVRIEYALERYDDSPEGGLMKHVEWSIYASNKHPKLDTLRITCSAALGIIDPALYSVSV